MAFLMSSRFLTRRGIPSLLSRLAFHPRWLSAGFVEAESASKEMKQATAFSNLKLSPVITKTLQRKGIDLMTEVQEESIPVVMEGCDVMVSAKTGTGKTLAFAIPMVHRFMKGALGQTLQGKRMKRGKRRQRRISHLPRGLILCPTRELAQQVAGEFEMLGRRLGLAIVLCVGGLSRGMQHQRLRAGADIVVGTPGRVVDHLESGALNAQAMEVLVLDEADRMLEFGFRRELESILDEMPTERQTLLFSATLEGEVIRVAREYMKDDTRQIHCGNKERIPEQITQSLFAYDNRMHKNKLLVHMLEEAKDKQVLVFCATKRGADDLAGDLIDGNFLQKSFQAAPLHGDMSMDRRQAVMQRFVKGKIKVLCATDVCSRGLDVRGVGLVVNYDLPNTPEDYVHRVGRTGRAGAEGQAISLVSRDGWGMMRSVEKHLRKSVERRVVPGLEPRRNEEQQRRQGGRQPFLRRGGGNRWRDRFPSRGGRTGKPWEQRRLQDRRQTFANRGKSARGGREERGRRWGKDEQRGKDRWMPDKGKEREGSWVSHDFNDGKLTVRDKRNTKKADFGDSGAWWRQ